MKLKHIELFGFKTFPDKLRIRFDEKINVIVGPNGCGKSNIVDAIRFILGEQNLRELRLKNMNELIFNGSGSRQKAVTAVGRGVFINDGEIDFKYKDFAEISVERRYFRDGESEYIINGQAVLYREYANFFIDSGISFKFYSVIDHVKINSILNYKPEELRLLFEEASGIIKFKHQKKSALKKLSLGEENLRRINDIYNEVDKQEKLLKGQFEVLKKYKKLFEEKRYYEFVLFDRSRNKTVSSIEENKADVKNVELALININSKITAYENILIYSRSSFDEINENFRQFTDAKNHLIIDIAGLNADIKYDAQKIENLNFEKLKKDQELKDNDAVKLRSINKLDDIKNKRSEKEVLIKKFNADLNESGSKILERRQKIEEAKNSVDILRDDILDLTEKSQLLNNKIVFNTKNIQNIDARIINTEQSIVKTDKEILSDENISKSKEGLIKEIQNSLDVLRRSLQFESEKCGLVANELKELEFIKDRFAKDIFELELEISRLSKTIEHHEGFSEGSKQLLDQGKNFGVVSSIVDILEVESGFEKIVWKAFIDKLETIIVNNIDDASKAVLYLNSNRLGSTKIFIPGKSKIKTKALMINDEDQMTVDKLSLISLKDKIMLNPPENCKNSIIEISSLGLDFYYTEDSQSIFNFIKEERFFPNVNIISGDGTIFISAGIIIAGQNKSEGNENLLINKKKLVEFRKSIKDKKLELSKISSDADHKKAIINEINQKVEALNNGIRLKEMAKLTAENDLIHINNRITKSKERLNIIEKEKDNMSLDKNKMVEENDKLEKELNAINITKEEKIKEKKGLEVKLGLNEEEFEEAKEKEVQLRIKLSSEENDLKFLIKEINNVDFNIKNSIVRSEKINLQISEIEKEIEITNSNLLEKKSNIAKLNEQFAEKEEEIKKFEGRLETLKVDINNTDQVLNRLKREKNELEKKKDKALTYIKILEDKLYEINIYDFSDEEIEKYSNNIGKIHNIGNINNINKKEINFGKLTDADLKKKIEDVKLKMVEFGNINMNAEEEYNDTLNRLNFLTDQREDLNDSIKSLEDIIKKLEHISKEKFNSDLERIRLKFHDLFCFLFGGGVANILSVKGEKTTDTYENEDVDTSGIEINVQMPGKKLSGINLLSQGEKVLVAISLIFAIFMVKKTPFCVIDEVDAPLDEANNERYNKLIKEISASSQVIMVTHNKKTMEIGDYIFGVTSKEPGISKVLSVVMN